MKKRHSLLTAIALLCALLLSGCGTEPSDPAPEHSQTPPAVVSPTSGFSYGDLEGMEFMFSSGVGAWFTSLRVHPDGTFEGIYQDTDMGDSGETYPNGTQYYSAFTGSFAPAEAVNDYTVSTRIETITYEREPGEELKDGLREVYVLAHGLENAEEILIYLPDAPLAELPEPYLQWIHLWSDEPGDRKLDTYGLYNVQEELGFLGCDPLPTAREQIQAILDAAETTDADLLTQWNDEKYPTQADMNCNAGDRFANWDRCLNDIWAVLDSVLPQEKMDVLRQEELAWIREKEAAVEESGKEVEGGSLYATVTNSTAARWTRDRAYVLADYLNSID